MKTVLAALAVAGCCMVGPAAAETLETIYTELGAGHCRTLTVSEPDGSVQRCPGVAGFRLLVEDGDARQSVTVETPDGRAHPLNFWHVVTTAFSHVGEKAEWRVARVGGKPVPRALIVRLYANENPEAPEEQTSYLTVTRLGGERVCVVAKVKHGPKANETARQLADGAGSRPCLE